ncbi:MAG: purine-nucleoside phosphorylase, partial [Spirochaetia bacterium]|nr:purine-nucleoside phosphorylase [Spirochaetia bacterium]
MDNKISEAYDYLRKFDYTPETAVVLGSGLGNFADNADDVTAVPYSDIPNFPVSTAPGHSGKLIFGRIHGKDVLLMQGRFHTYEGYGGKEIAIPIRTMKLLGVKNLILTNSAGGVNTSFRQGDLMLITDHINYSGKNPLIGPNDDDFGPRFPDMSEAYDMELQKIACTAA